MDSYNNAFRIDEYYADGVIVYRHSEIADPSSKSIEMPFGLKEDGSIANEGVLYKMQSGGLKIKDTIYENERDRMLLTTEIVSIKEHFRADKAIAEVVKVKEEKAVLEGETAAVIGKLAGKEGAMKSTIEGVEVLMKKSKGLPKVIWEVIHKKPSDWAEAGKMHQSVYDLCKKYLLSLPIVNLPKKYAPLDDFTFETSGTPFIGVVKNKAYLIDPQGYNYSRYAIGIPQLKFAGGGRIKNQYSERTDADIWNSWRKSQRFHFLKDHNISALVFGQTATIENNKSALKKLLVSSYTDLPNAVKSKLLIHTAEGQYDGGGKTKKGRWVVFYHSKETGGMRERHFTNKVEAEKFAKGVNSEAISYAGGGKGERKFSSGDQVRVVKIISSTRPEKLNKAGVVTNAIGRDLYAVKFSDDTTSTFMKSELEAMPMAGGGIIKKATKKDKFWHMRVRTPKGVSACATPDWAKTMASTVHPGAKVTMCKYGADWHIQKVMIPVNGVSKSEATNHAEAITNKINKK